MGGNAVKVQCNGMVKAVSEEPLLYYDSTVQCKNSLDFEINNNFIQIQFRNFLKAEE